MDYRKEPESQDCIGKMKLDDPEPEMIAIDNERHQEENLIVTNKWRSGSLESSSSSKRTVSESSTETIEISHIEPDNIEPHQEQPRQSSKLSLFQKQLTVDTEQSLIDEVTITHQDHLKEDTENVETLDNINQERIQLLQELIHKRSQLKEMDRYLFALISQNLSQLDSEDARVSKLINWLPIGEQRCDLDTNNLNHNNHHQNPIIRIEESEENDIAIDLSVPMQTTGLSYNQLVDGDEKVSTPSTASSSNPLNTWLSHLKSPDFASSSSSSSMAGSNNPNSLLSISPGVDCKNSSILNFRKSRLLNGVNLSTTNLKNGATNYTESTPDPHRSVNCASDGNSSVNRKRHLEKIIFSGINQESDINHKRTCTDGFNNLMAQQFEHKLQTTPQEPITQHQTNNPFGTNFTHDQLELIFRQSQNNFTSLIENYNKLLTGGQIAGASGKDNERTTLNVNNTNNLIEKFMMLRGASGGSNNQQQQPQNHHHYHNQQSMTTFQQPETVPNIHENTSKNERQHGINQDEQQHSSQQQQQQTRVNLDYELLARLSCDQQKLLAHQCHVCGSGFEDRHRLQQHLSIHLNLHPNWFEEKTIKETMVEYESKRGDYLCKQCSIRYETTTEFDKHMQMHGEKPHTCDLCLRESKNVSFRFYRQLLTHLRSHCFLYCCRFEPDCKQKANRKDYLKLHILKHHLNNKLPECYTICCH